MDDYRYEQPEERFEFNAGAQAIWGDIAKWARFLAITGVILCSLLIIAGAFSILYYSSGSYLSDEVYYAIYRMVFLVVTCLVHLFILVRLLQFANRMGQAVKEGNEVHLQSAIGSLRSVFRSLGIFTIIFCIFYLMVYLIKSTL